MILRPRMQLGARAPHEQRRLRARPASQLISASPAIRSTQRRRWKVTSSLLSSGRRNPKRLRVSNLTNWRHTDQPAFWSVRASSEARCPDHALIRRVSDFADTNGMGATQKGGRGRDVPPASGRPAGEIFKPEPSSGVMPSSAAAAASRHGGGEITPALGGQVAVLRRTLQEFGDIFGQAGDHADMRLLDIDEQRARPDSCRRRSCYRVGLTPCTGTA